jgi:hypothetical protein
MTPDEATGYGQYNSGNFSNARVDELVVKNQSGTKQYVSACCKKSNRSCTTRQRLFRFIGRIELGRRGRVST